jgi:hypothetical protein
MMYISGVIVMVLVASIFNPAATASHLRLASRHAEVPKALIQTLVSLDRTDKGCEPGSDLCTSVDSSISVVETKSAHHAQYQPEWAKSGLLTMHACECADYWQFDGFTHRGCALVSDHLNQRISQALCFVKDEAKCKSAYAFSKLSNVTGSTGVCKNETCASPSESSWDFCSRVEDVSPFMTQSSCHCHTAWEHKSKLYKGCSRINASEPAWCYVAETQEGCDKAKDAGGEKTQRWDFCNLPEEKPAYVTRKGCHCKPSWKSGDKDYSSCVQEAEKKWPAELKKDYSSLSTLKQTLLGWCQVFEDGRRCPASIEADGFVVDACFMADEATRNTLDLTYNGCHCQPEWNLDNETYKGCSKTKDGQEVTPWCPVLEDSKVCSQSSSPSEASDTGAGRGPGWNWDYCDDGTADAAMWRQPGQRFTPNATENVPDWYQDILDKLGN